MLGVSAATAFATLCHHPAGVEIVRASSRHFGGDVKFVFIDTDRAYTIAANGPVELQPRLPRASEQAVCGGALIASDNATTAARVQLAEGQTAALTLDRVLSPDVEVELRAFAASLSIALTASPVADTSETSTETEILAALRDVVIVLGADFTMKWANAATLTLLGYTPNELVGTSALGLIHPDDVDLALEATARLSEGDRVYRVRLRLRDAAGQWQPVAVTGLDHTSNPGIGGLVLSVRADESETENEQRMEHTQRVSSTILHKLTDAVISTDELGAITIVNEAARTLFEIGRDTPPSALSIRDLALYDEDGSLLRADEHPLSPTATWLELPLQIQSPSGMRYVTTTRSQVTRHGKHLGVVVTFHDITQARSDAKELRNRAFQDQLTGLANRRHLGEQLEGLAIGGVTPPLAACFIDLDDFKNVNDIHGHTVGDAVLQVTASRLRDQIGQHDLLARPGGDEFLVILVDPPAEAAVIEVAERIRSALTAPFEVGGIRLDLTASVGIAIHDRGALDEDRLVRHADIALYAAKDSGRDRVEIFDQQLATTVELEQAQRNMVRDALEHDRLVMHYQPIVADDGSTIGVEALARCMTDGGNVIEPSGFLDAIDGTNLMLRLDRAGFEQSCRVAKRMAENERTAHVWVASNFSAMTLAQANFAEDVLATIERIGVDPARICVEVTETAAFEAGETGIAALARLADAGVRISLDDFGTGYSSLAHLRDLPLTTVKIDRSFTSALNEHGAERAIATAVKELASSLGFGVVAEGVETAADRAAVSEIGVTSMQGWYFAKAIPAAELHSSLEHDGEGATHVTS